MVEIIEINDTNFDKEVLEEKGLCLIDFMSNWCVQCKAMSNILDNVSKDINGIKIFKVDIEKSPKIVEKLEISTLPTLSFFKNSEEIGRSIGLRTKDKIIEMIEIQK